MERVQNFQMSSSRFYALDGLRLIAALMVAGYHYCFVASRDGFSPVIFYPEITKYMYLGVELFFILSGFVICYSAANKTVKSFLILRCVRLYPAFWFCMLITFLGVHLIFGDPRFNATWWDAFLNLTMLPGLFGGRMVDGVYWTLLVEIKFYVLFSLFLITKQWVKLEWSLLVWMLLYGVNHHITSVPFARLVAFPESPLFMIGILIYLVVINGISKFRVMALAIALALTYSYELGHTVSLANNFGLAFDMRYIFSIIVFIVGIVWLAAKVSVANWVQKLGDLTYPFYLLHDYLGLILISVLASIFHPVGAIVLVCLAMLIAAHGVNRYVEVPVQKLIKNYLKKKKWSGMSSSIEISVPLATIPN